MAIGATAIGVEPRPRSGSSGRLARRNKPITGLHSTCTSTRPSTPTSSSCRRSPRPPASSPSPSPPDTASASPCNLPPPSGPSPKRWRSPASRRHAAAHQPLSPGRDDTVAPRRGLTAVRQLLDAGVVIAPAATTSAIRSTDRQRRPAGDRRCSWPTAPDAGQRSRRSPRRRQATLGVGHRIAAGGRPIWCWSVPPTCGAAIAAPAERLVIAGGRPSPSPPPSLGG